MNEISVPTAPAESIQTPLAPRLAPAVIIRFSKWTAFGRTAYQAGQCAGFSRRDADAIIKAGAGREVR